MGLCMIQRRHDIQEPSLSVLVRNGSSAHFSNDVLFLKSLPDIYIYDLD